MKKILLIFYCLSVALRADVKSTTGTIEFDVQSDQVSEMTLNQVGLGLGVTPAANLHVKGNAMVAQQLMIGGSSSSANLGVQGTLGFSTQTVSSNALIGEHSVVFIDTVSDNISLTLPYSANVLGQQIYLKKIARANQAYIHANPSDHIDGHALVILPEESLHSITLVSTSTNTWSILGNGPETLVWNPFYLTPATWYDASNSDSITLNSGNVSQWNDLSGNDNHLKQSSSTEQPSYTSNQSVDFDGMDDLIERVHSSDTIRNAFSADGSATLAVVMSTLDFTDANVTFPVVVQFISAASGVLSRKPMLSFQRTSDKLYYSVSQGVSFTAQISSASSYNSQTLVVGTQGNTFSDLYIQGAFADSANAIVYDGETTPDSIKLNSVNLKAYSINEVVLIAKDVSSADRQRLEGYLAHKWNLEGELPDDHPYKSAPPTL